MALQDICQFQDVFLHSKVTEDASVPFGQKTKHSYISRLPLSNSESFYFYIPVAEYLEESPIQFGQIGCFPVSAVDSILPGPMGTPLAGSSSVPLPFPMSHGTTTLAFLFQGGVLAAADTRSSCSGLVACPAAQKILPIHSHLVGTTSGTSADCALWKRILSRELRLYQLRHGRRLSTGGAAKLLSHMLHPFKGTELCVAATLCGWDGGVLDQTSQTSLEENRTTMVKDISQVRDQASGQETASPATEGQTTRPSSSAMGGWQCDDDTKVSGPRLYYVCSDGTRLKGALFSVGSGSPYAYSILDQEVRWGLAVDEAISVAREAVYRATHRDAYSGNCVDVYHVTSRGWRRRNREDLKEEYYRERLRKEEKEKDRRERLEQQL